MYTTITEVIINRPDLPETVHLDSPLAVDVLGIDPNLFCLDCDRFGGHYVRKVTPLTPLPPITLFDRVYAVAKGRVAHL